MIKLTIKIKLLSESIFGNGASESNGADTSILFDEIGVPYFKGKTLKGKLREEVSALQNYISCFSKNKYNEITAGLFGKEGNFNSDTLKFSNCTIQKDIWDDLNFGIESRKITKEDILNSLTEIRTFTRLNEDGAAETGSLRTARVIKRDLILYCNVECQRELTSSEKGILSAGIASLKNLGSMESRGKGNVKCSLIEDNQDVTLKYIDGLEREV